MLTRLRLPLLLIKKYYDRGLHGMSALMQAHQELE
jgi:hypothetical protein